MELTRPAGVLFDAGGTLVKIRTARLAAALRSRGHEIGGHPDAFWRALVLMDSEFTPHSVGDRNWWLDWQTRLAEHAEVPAAVLHEAYAEVDAEAFLWDEPLPGALECLTRLRQGGLRVGVVSNADGRMAEALERAGLAAMLEVIVDSTLVGVAKPDPSIFDHALDPLGLAPEDTWYVGDTVHYDAAAADAAGMTSWVIDHGRLHTVDHPRRIHSLAEVADLALATP